MRIDAYSQVQQVYQKQRIEKKQNNVKVDSTSDQLQISSFGKEIHSAKAAVNAAPDIREDVISPIKESIQNGTYQVSVQDFADKLISKYEEMR